MPAKIEIDKEQFIETLGLFPSKDEMAVIFRCSDAKIDDYCKRELGAPFQDCRKRYVARTRMALKRVAIKRALNRSDKLMMFLLERFCDMVVPEVIPEGYDEPNYPEIKLKSDS